MRAGEQREEGLATLARRVEVDEQRLEGAFAVSWVRLLADVTPVPVQLEIVSLPVAEEAEVLIEADRLPGGTPATRRDGWKEWRESLPQQVRKVLRLYDVMKKVEGPSSP